MRNLAGPKTEKIRGYLVSRIEPNHAVDHFIRDLVDRPVRLLGVHRKTFHGVGDGAAELHADHARGLVDTGLEGAVSVPALRHRTHDTSTRLNRIVVG